MKTKVKLDKRGLPVECPKCGSDDLCICNDDGMECMECGCWFEAGEEGRLIFVYAARPQEIL